MDLEQAQAEPRESMDYDVVIVGAGPAGLSAAIRLKQLDEAVSVVVVEKGAEVGAHILSGAVIDPVGLDALLPGWREDEACPLTTEVSEDIFYFLTEPNGIRLPNFGMPKLMNNHGNFVGSLGLVTKYLAARAEALGVEIYPGFAAAELLYNEDGSVAGIATGDMGIAKDGTVSERFTRGMELRGRYTLLGEGARGSLSKIAIRKFGLDAGREPQKYGIGLKEVWQVKPEKFHKGRVQHSFGWPLDNGTGGGSFLYHFDDNLVTVGFVVHLNYTNPTLSPFDEFQRFKTHPLIRDLFEGAKRLSYGSRAITEGGWQSVPKLTFPGGALIGCAAGFVNVPRIKGSHNAVLSGMMAAEKLVPALAGGRSHDEVVEIETSWRESAIGADLKPVRNVKPLWSKYGTLLGIGLGGIDMWLNQLFGWSPFGTLKHGKPDHATLKPLSEVKPIVYPKPDGKISFDKLSSVFLSSTNHEEDQPAHLKLTDPSIPIGKNLPLYGEPARLYCPAGVYEVVYADAEAKTEPRFVINAQNCVHCKTCDIKDPAQNITWTVPEGGGGPGYGNM
ncbi:electron transfer flavoprotein-ubiquinone oxidoreductase [Bosea sp. 124]|uniref:electron transfer flavoprotein-ubiquinone oxidoreductase n=1 Tax=Bosea sp. 124 TaxID=2135642 RepID=UPI000D45E5E3|nr:electron transfer flavoprotein-ubiquinone oxidoreductase [Bosea sp. 124]PTM38987.1 flavin-dependent dehydrogenase [Bosea sp. 124]